jgi:hypothetical protein
MAKHEREWDKLFDERGVDLMTKCIVGTCDTQVTRRAGICSEHWRALTFAEREEIQAASAADDRQRWIAAVRKAANRLAEEAGER